MLHTAGKKKARSLMIGNYDPGYLLTQSVNILVLIGSQYFNGLLVIHKNVRVNYTRKINHFMLFFVPILLNRGYAHYETYGLFIIGAFLAVAKFIFYTGPVRNRVPFINVMFTSFDRPEDRPHTLLWLVTQTAAGYMVLIPMSILFAAHDLLEFVLIPILIYGIGDGLAEPVGVRFGRHRYRTPALFTGKEYYRTLEGSAAVFFTSLAIIAAYYNYFTPQQFLAAIIAVPVIMTLVEALSPHTWDAPTLFLAGYITLYSIAMI